MTRHAEIVGAGIGGLAAGIALRNAGWSVRVSERAPSVEPLGAGLSLWPNAVRSLRALGLGALAEEPGVAFGSDGAVRRADGSVIADFEPNAIEERFGAPLIGVHRGDLQAALASELGAEPLRLATEVESVEEGSVKLRGGESVAADLVVGADGLRSTVRSHVLGREEPRRSGIVSYRGIADLNGTVIPAGEWWGPGTVAGLLPVSGGRAYWYLGFRGSADAQPGDAEEAARIASDFAPPVPELVASTPREAVLHHELFDRPPAKRWSTGSVTLLGDAAHPMLPFLGQGACSALDDAVALGAALDGEDDVATALQAYEKPRAKLTAKLVRGSRMASRMALLKPAPLRAARNFALAALPDGAHLRQLDGFVGRP